MKTIVIDGEKYAKCSDIEMAKGDDMDYAIVRTYSAGVFAGYIRKQEGKEVEILNSRRIWYWKGAASLSQLAVDGTSKPDECKFPIAVPKQILTEVIEILFCTKKAMLSISEVPIWKE